MIKVEKGIFGEQIEVKVTRNQPEMLQSNMWQGENLLFVKRKLLRYMGSDENITLPVGADGEKAMTEVGELAHSGENLLKR